MTQEFNEDTSYTHDEFIAEFARNSRRIYCYIRSLVPNRNDADDVYQNTSMVMWRKFQEFTLGGNFFAWGCQIALFEIRKMRSSGRRRHLFSDEALEALNAEFHARSDDTPGRLTALSSCIQKLAPKSRWLIEQRYYHERSAKELASEMGSSLASLYRSLARTHAWLLACIQQMLSQESQGGS
ncbi:sigma-70 family RNA polymerase sigma factor [Bythopirellula polymerisocia]|uniref:RNA polymerase sigma factor n=1 Tax=Bythopirellula polymerisocia TaxID=2528003 RepID=A0A5C6CB11_9BACT|nr:sigma-70 family RNA polymerase sigma factor [Bythopirellula polymerisocia]TWU21800.1 RNA polymerase sigma factor [Bythopirellula polymerisocia]